MAAMAFSLAASSQSTSWADFSRIAVWSRAARSSICRRSTSVFLAFVTGLGQLLLGDRGVALGVGEAPAAAEPQRSLGLAPGQGPRLLGFAELLLGDLVSLVGAFLHGSGAFQLLGLGSLAGDPGQALAHLADAGLGLLHLGAGLQGIDLREVLALLDAITFLDLDALQAPSDRAGHHVAFDDAGLALVFDDGAYRSLDDLREVDRYRLTSDVPGRGYDRDDDDQGKDQPAVPGALVHSGAFRTVTGSR